ncbi:MAG: hypothetical protein NW205_06565 [Hyphomicrobiaceae bacterium]|nr:hypothetical protein [Hyphomicrobiaceae bacterium]
MSTIASPPALSEARSRRLRSRQSAEAQYRIIFAASIAFFLVAVIAARAVRVVRAPFEDGVSGEPDKSLITEARELAHSTLPYAFMG